jgi:hypothetical protein
MRARARGFGNQLLRFLNRAPQVHIDWGVLNCCDFNHKNSGARIESFEMADGFKVAPGAILKRSV